MRKDQSLAAAALPARRVFLKLSGAILGEAALCNCGGGDAGAVAASPPPQRQQAMPAIGTCASSVDQYDATVQAAGRPLKWNLRYGDDTYALNTAALDDLAGRGVQWVVVTLQVQSTLVDIANGGRDGKLQGIARQLKLWQDAHPSVTLIVRPLHEMNGDWYAWGFKGGHNGNSAPQFNAAWLRVRKVLRQEFPTLPFMWCPNVLMGAADDYAAYYPGDDQVEYLGLDGYNHSTSGGGWQTITQVFERSLAAIRSMPGSNPAKPLVIAETATTEPDAPSALKGHTKAEWFGNTQGNLGWWLVNVARTYGVTAVLYFDYKKLLNGSTNDYLIFDSTIASAVASRDAFRQAIASLP